MSEIKITPKIEESWKNALLSEFNSSYFAQLKEFLLSERKLHTIYPPASTIFEAFNKTPLHKVKVVILGQDPYHGPGQAHGLSFSVPQGLPLPPSLQNIFKEISDDIGLAMPKNGNLESWAAQGVLLLNATLTVRAHQAGSHQKQGWERFTNAAIKAVSENNKGVIFLLWGSYAQAKAELIDQSKHHVLKAPHPSPLSAYRGFFGCRHFSQTNALLINQGLEPINWTV